MTLALLRLPSGDAEVISASLVLPLVGVPRYYVELDADDILPPGTPCRLLVGAGEVTEFVGTVARAVAFEGRVTVTIAGGAGALSEEPELRRLVEPAGYLGTPYAAEGRLMVDQILAGTGETLGEAAGSLLAGLTLPRWHRQAGSAGSALAALARAWGLSWRVLASGEVWLGTETWVVEENDTADAGVVEFAHEDERADLAPGMTLGGRRVIEVVYTLTPEGLRGTARYQQAAPAPRAAWLYGASNAARVVRQNADGSVDVLPEADGLRGQGLDRVPVRLGVSRARVVLGEAQRVVVRFEASDTFPAGDPGRPYVADIEQDAAAQRPAARRGDRVQCGSITIIKNPPQPGPPGITVTFTPATSPYDPLPAVPQVLVIAGSFQLIPAQPFTMDLVGWIDTGSPDVMFAHHDDEETP